MSQKDNLRSLIISSTLTTGDNTLIAAGQLGPGMGSIQVYQIYLESTAAEVVTPKSNATIIPGQVTLAAGQQAILENTGTPWWKTLPGQALVLNLSAGGGVLSGTIWYSLA